MNLSTVTLLVGATFTGEFSSLRLWDARLLALEPEPEQLVVWAIP